MYTNRHHDTSGTRSNGDTGLFPEAYVEEISGEGPHPQPPPYPGPPQQEGFSYKQAPKKTNFLV